MIVTSKPCPGCGTQTDFVVSEEAWKFYKSGMLAQDIWPHWTPEELEILISGMCPKCWEEMLPPEDEDEYDWFTETQIQQGREIDEAVEATGHLPGYLNGDEDSDWRDSDKDWYVD